MPNTEVKLTNAESTWLEAAREDRKLLINIKRTLKGVSFFMSIVNGPNPPGAGIAGEPICRSESDAQRE